MDTLIEWGKYLIIFAVVYSVLAWLVDEYVKKKIADAIDDVEMRLTTLEEEVEKLGGFSEDELHEQ